jgi:hypothetical protein
MCDWCPYKKLDRNRQAQRDDGGRRCKKKTSTSQRMLTTEAGRRPKQRCPCLEKKLPATPGSGLLPPEPLQ